MLSCRTTRGVVAGIGPGAALELAPRFGLWWFPLLGGSGPPVVECGAFKRALCGGVACCTVAELGLVNVAVGGWDDWCGSWDVLV